MTTEMISLWDWAKKIPLPPTLFEPLATLRVDWKQMASHLAARFGLSHLSLHASAPQWRPSSSLQMGTGEAPFLLGMEVAPLTGSLFWLMSRKDAETWTSWLWKEPPALSAESLREGFYRYTILECLDALHELAPFKQHSIQLNDEIQFPEEGACVIDVTLQCGQDSARGRLIFSQELYRQLAHTPPHWATQAQARAFSLSCPLLMSQLFFSIDRLNQIHPGDFIPLRDSASRGLLYVEEKPLFKVKIQGNKMEILDYATIMKAEPEEPLLSSLKDLPVPVSVELARLRIPLEQLMQFSPGNVIELPISAPSTVSLTVNGEKIGSAELVSLGETLGLQIIEISSPVQ